MINFGAGKLIATPTMDATGNAVANPTPVTVAVLQDVSVDFDYETKTLHGSQQFPVAVGRGKGKITWKAKSGDFSGSMLGSLFLGQAHGDAPACIVEAGQGIVPLAQRPGRLFDPEQGQCAHQGRITRHFRAQARRLARLEGA